MLFANNGASFRSRASANCSEEVFIHPESEKFIFEVKGKAVIDSGAQHDLAGIFSELEQHSNSSVNGTTNWFSILNKE